MSFDPLPKTSFLYLNVVGTTNSTPDSLYEYRSNPPTGLESSLGVGASLYFALSHSNLDEPNCWLTYFDALNATFPIAPESLLMCSFCTRLFQRLHGPLGIFLEGRDSVRYFLIGVGAVFASPSTLVLRNSVL